LQDGDEEPLHMRAVPDLRPPKVSLAWARARRVTFICL
jgi:hypothetical protein